MSLSYSNCFSDLLCSEISPVESPECSSDLESPASSEESIAEFIEDEKHFVLGFDYLSRFQTESLDASSREQSVAWILKVTAYYGFQPLTAYLSVNYLDRFLYSRQLPEASGWPWQLLSVACLSLAAKMEEPLVPSLLDLQVGGSRYVFEARTIQKMELLVLSVLDWRMRSITPFSFLAFFASKLDTSASYAAFLISRASAIILSIIPEARFVEYWPSCIAAAAILCAANEVSNVSLVNNPECAQSWCDGLSGEKIIRCYRLMQQIVVDTTSTRITPKAIPNPQVTVDNIGTKMRSSSQTTSSPSYSSSSSTSSSCHKRRKLYSSDRVMGEQYITHRANNGGTRPSLLRKPQ